MGFYFFLMMNKEENADELKFIQIFFSKADVLFPVVICSKILLTKFVVIMVNMITDKQKNKINQYIIMYYYV